MNRGIDVYSPHHNLIVDSRLFTKSSTFSNGITQNGDFRDDFKEPVEDTDHGTGTRFNDRLEGKLRIISASGAAGNERPRVELYMMSYIKGCNCVGHVVLSKNLIE